MATHTSITFFLLLPKIAHPVTFPVMCELCKKKTKILLVNDCTSSFLSYLCRTFALFSTWKQFSQPLSLGVQFTFHKENAVTVSWTLKLFSAPLIAKVLLSCWKRIINWQGKKCIVLTATYNGITFLTIISDWLQFLWLWPFQPLELVFTVCRLWWV